MERKGAAGAVPRKTASFMSERMKGRGKKGKFQRSVFPSFFIGGGGGGAFLWRKKKKKKFQLKRKLFAGVSGKKGCSSAQRRFYEVWRQEKGEGGSHRRKECVASPAREKNLSRL